jgi:hypothetical protein
MIREVRVVPHRTAPSAYRVEIAVASQIFAAASHALVAATTSAFGPSEVLERDWQPRKARAIRNRVA